MKPITQVLRGNLLVFTMGDLIRQLSMFITFPYFSLYIQAMGGNAVDIGLVNSLRPLAALFIYPIAGYIADRHNRVKIIAASAYVTAALYLIFILAPDWRYLAVGNFLMGLVVFQFPAMNSLMADSLPSEQRGVGYSLWIAIPSAVGIVSPFIGGYLITLLGVEKAMRLLYSLTVLATVGIGMLDLKFLRETKREVTGAPERRPLQTLSESFRDMLSVLRWLPGSLKAFALMLILSFFFNSLSAPYWVVYSVERIGLSELQWGIILLLASIVNAVLLVPAGMIVDRFSVKKILSIASVLSAVPVLLFPFSRSFEGTALVIVAMTATSTFLTAGAPAFMAHSVPRDRRGRVMAALGQGMLFINTRGGQGGPGMGMFLAIPSVLGSVLGGFIYGLGQSTPWILLAASMIVNAVISLFFLSSPEANEN